METKSKTKKVSRRAARREERAKESAGTSQYRVVMRILAVVYGLAGSMFFFFPDMVFYLLNFVPNTFGLGQVIPLDPARFWLVLTTSMMAMLVALSLLAAESPYVRGYALVHALSKSTSSALFLLMYFQYKPYFGFLVGFATDFPLALLVMYMMARVRRAKEA